MTFVEFTIADGGKAYFVGTSVVDILTEAVSLGWEYSTFRGLQEESMASLGLQFYQQGVQQVKEGHAKSYLLGTVGVRQKERETSQ